MIAGFNKMFNCCPNNKLSWYTRENQIHSDMMTSHRETAGKLLTDGIKMLGLNAYSSASRGIEPYLLYLETLQKWNKTYNLTHITALPDMAVQHVLDSLSIAPYLEKTRYLDLGSGAGLPGIVLAIFYPDKQFVLLDSNSKKTAFLTQAKQLLKLDNVEIVTSRAENYQPKALFDGTMSRAVGSLKLLTQLSRPFLKPESVVLAMKSQTTGKEISDLPPGVQAQATPLTVPFLNATRQVVVLHV